MAKLFAASLADIDPLVVWSIGRMGIGVSPSVAVGIRSSSAAVGADLEEDE